jgi:hypothetical protein
VRVFRAGHRASGGTATGSSGQARPAPAHGHEPRHRPDGRRRENPDAQVAAPPTSLQTRRPDSDNTTRIAELLVRVAIPHGRYTIAVHLDSLQVWVIDTSGRDRPRGPYPSSRQAWAIANDLNSNDPTPTTGTTT